MDGEAGGRGELLALRAPPQNLQVEQALLGTLLSNNKTLAQVEEYLRPEHFYDPLNGRIYGLILRRVAMGSVADALTLAPMIENDPAFAEVGGRDYLSNLLLAMVGRDIRTYGQAIRDAWMRRELIAVCAEAIDACYLPPADGTTAGTAEALEAGVSRVMAGAGDEAPSVPIGDALQQAVAAAVAAAARPTALAGISTGYRGLDRLTLGLQAPDLVLLGARPSMGKTALGLGIAIRAAMTGTSVYFWSGEMGAGQLAARAAAAYAMLPTQAVFTGRNWAVPPDRPGGVPPKLLQPDWDKLILAERAAYTLPLEFDTRSGITPQAVRARARRMKRKPDGLGLIVLDYIGLMQPSERLARSNLYERTTAISRELMALKAELNVPILALVQLNRGNEGRDDKMPQMSDLRDSGALEQDANVVMLLHRPHYYLSRNLPQRRSNENSDTFQARVDDHEKQTRHEEGWGWLNVVKNRNGAAGMTRLRFHDQTTWFRDRDEAEDAPAWGGRLDI
jgi:replicative DNA helicase